MTESERAAEVERVVAGDADALQRLILHYHGMLRHAVVHAIAGDTRGRIDADDVLQRAYVTAFRRIEDCSFDTVGGFYKWLEAVAVSRLRDEERSLRRAGRIQREADLMVGLSTRYPAFADQLTAGEPTPSHRLARDEAIAAVMTSLARLNEDQRTVVRERFLLGRPVAEIARRLGKSEGAIHALCHRGLKTLRSQMVSLTRYLTRL